MFEAGEAPRAHAHAARIQKIGRVIAVTLYPKALFWQRSGPTILQPVLFDTDSGRATMSIHGDRLAGVKPLLSLLLGGAMAVSVSAQEGPSPWSDASIAGYRLPLAGLGHAPKMVSGAAYYALPEVNLKTYPVYTPDKEPKGYLEWLQARDPEPMVDIGKLKTREKWSAAGRQWFYGRQRPA